MAKLSIVYRIKDNEDDYFRGKTHYTYSFVNGNTEISIAPNETRKLADIVYGIEKDLQNGYTLQENEKFEIDEVSKAVMEVEKNSKKRVDSMVYNFCKSNYEKVLEGITTIDMLIKTLEEGVVHA